jgi:hypothetical protein
MPVTLSSPLGARQSRAGQPPPRWRRRNRPNLVGGSQGRGHGFRPRTDRPRCRDRCREIRLTRCHEDLAEPVTNGGRLVSPSSGDSVGANRSGMEELDKSPTGHRMGEIDDSVPVAEYLEERDLRRVEVGADASRSTRSVHETDLRNRPRWSAWYGYDVDRGNLRGQSEVVRRTQAGRTYPPCSRRRRRRSGWSTDATCQTGPAFRASRGPSLPGPRIAVLRTMHYAKFPYGESHPPRSLCPIPGGHWRDARFCIVPVVGDFSCRSVEQIHWLRHHFRQSIRSRT